MALKPKTPIETAATLPPVNDRYEEFIRHVRPEVDARLTTFMKENPRSTEFADYMVKRHPDRAVRALMLDKMFKHEVQMAIVQREAPQAKEWLEQQTPSLKDWIKQKLQGVNPFYREKTELSLIKKVKNKIDFSPRTGLGQGQSL
jgi:hypothetical protein